MTDPQIQIAVAKARGYEDVTPGFWEDDGTFTKHWNGELHGVWSKSGMRSTLPRYLNSHDAMAEALGTMQEWEWVRYDGFLRNSIALQKGDTNVQTWEVLRATPRQQAVAFLKATNNYTP